MMKEEDNSREANKSVLEQMQDLLKKKDAAKINNQIVFKEMKKEQLAAEKLNPQPTKPAQTSKVNTVPKEAEGYLERFEKRLVHDFNLRVNIDKYGWHQLFFGDFKVFELVPRKGFWYGVYREDPEQDNKWKCFRVTNDQDEAVNYAYCKEFVEINK
jgi:uncharacterized protein (DUF2267 family)